MYEVLAGNRVRKMPDWPKPEWEAYAAMTQGFRDRQLEKKYDEDCKDWQKENEAGEIFPISGSHNWKEGQLIEEGKDFKFIDRIIGTTADGYDNKYEAVAIPIPSLTNEEDELWRRVIDIFMGVTVESGEDLDSTIVLKLKQHFTIKRKKL